MQQVDEVFALAIVPSVAEERAATAVEARAAANDDPAAQAKAAAVARTVDSEAWAAYYAQREEQKHREQLHAAAQPTADNSPSREGA